MIRLRGWRPAHGWAPFVTELVIVVVGVLIALAAQQAVESWNTARKLADFRQALAKEIGDNLGAYAGRLAQGECLSRRLDELDVWQADWRVGSGPAMDGRIGRPLAFRAGSVVWQTGAADLAASLPLDERLAYARLYGGFEGYRLLADREVVAWQGLYAFDNASTLSPSEVNALRGHILAARSTDRSIRANFPELRDLAAEKFGIVVPASTDVFDPDFCKRLRFEE